MSKKYKGIWIGEKDLNGDSKLMRNAQDEFESKDFLEKLGESRITEELEGSRRDFLKLLGFGLGAATIAAGCDIPVKRAIPYVVKPDEIVPGVAVYYASTWVDRGEYCPVIVKTREGRPIKIEGNSLSSVTKGGTSARAQASVLSLYDVDRLRGPMIKSAEVEGFEAVTWSDLDTAVSNAINTAGSVRFLSNTILSPTYRKLLSDLESELTDFKQIIYDPVSYEALLNANEACFGQRSIPNYHFDKADLVVSFNADFLGTWISPIEYAKAYTENRKIKDSHQVSMSKHVQIENSMSLTGSNADNRILVKPSERMAAVAFLYNELTGENIPLGSLNDKAKAALRALASQLILNRNRSLVISGNNNHLEQVLINGINEFLDNFGHTISIDRPSLLRQGSETALAGLIDEMNRGDVDVLIINDANPVYDTVYGERFREALGQVGTKVALNYKMSETAELCDYLASTHHFLESWGDAEPYERSYSLIQPAIHPLFDTRQPELSLLTWTNHSILETQSGQPYLDYIKKHWEEAMFTQQSEYSEFQSFWDKSLHDGIFELPATTRTLAMNADIPAMASRYSYGQGSDLEISFFEPVGVSNGQHANNPWLQEMPDPVTRCAWGNYLAVPVSFDGVRKFIGLNNLKDGDLVDLTVGDRTIRVPVIQQFGQMKGTVSLALGYGRTNGGFAANGTGVNVNPMTGVQPDGLTNYFATNVSVSNKKGKEKDFACVQYHHTMGVKARDKKTGEIINADEAATIFATYGIARQGPQGSLTKRSVIRNTHFDHLEEAVEELVHEREHFQELNEHGLYPYDEYYEEHYSQGHHWGMHVDLNSCIGCGACTVACMSENNVPVVGKHQISRHQEMAWIRIDRYYYGDTENPNTVYQPLMCQHCDNAPCENVCPVTATNHSSEGLNQMAYNRCIGTRYCANNCPYKVRRFNWLDYTTADIFPANQPSVNHEEKPYGADNLTRMVLNPDVTVRSRGVMEKCSFCVQRIQEGKLTAKKEGRKLNDADIRTACQTACPTGAITFGDRNNPAGELYTKYHSNLNYEVLEEINTRPSVRYSMRINNRDESLDA